MSEIRDFVFNEPLFETHEHLDDFKTFDKNRTEHPEDRDYRDFFGYLLSDLTTATNAKDDLRKIPFSEDFFFKHWDSLRTTGYGQAISLGTQKLFGLSFSESTAGEITRRLREYMAGKSAAEIYEAIFQKANVTGAIIDRVGDSYKNLDAFSGEDYPPSSKLTLRVNEFITCYSKERIEQFEQEFDSSISCLDDLLTIMRNHAIQANESGNMAAFKIAVAYERSIRFEDTPKETAEKIFDELLAGKKPDVTPLQDYIAHQSMQLAGELDRPVQIHTGHLAGTWHDVRSSNPIDLISTFQRHPNVRFDVFHASWPYSDIIGSVARSFPNVWLDMCWAWAMNPVQMERTLDEWLACLPNNKIFGFGGDTWTPFSMIGYAEQARHGITNVLEKKISTGEYDVDTARLVAARLMHKNAEEFFGVS